MKKLAKKMLAEMAARLPWGARKAILDRFGHEQGYLSLIAELAHRGITGILATGEYGTIQSAVGDYAIFETYARTGKWASSTNDLIATFFGEGGGTYLDIGANIGLTTIPAAQNPSVSVFAFEPDPTNFANLRENIARNCPHKNVVLHELALYRERAELVFELAKENLGDHRLRIGSGSAGYFGEDKRSTIVVQAAPLDEVVDEIRPPLAVKIDTQGAEPYVIEGGSHTLASAEMILLEWSPYHLRRLGGNPNAIIEFAKNHFSLGALSEGEGTMGALTDISEVVGAMESLLEKSANDKRFHKYADVLLRKSRK